MLEGGWEAWSSAAELPIERLPGYETLVDSAWLAAQIKNPSLQAAPIQIGHVNYDAQAEYDLEHIPGAVYLDTREFETTDTHNRRPQAEILSALRRLGINPQATLVLYGRDNLPADDGSGIQQQAGQIASMRLAAILTDAGLQDVRLLNGGFEAWQLAGQASETTRRMLPPQPAEAFLHLAAGTLFIDTPELQKQMADPDFQLASIRTWPEYLGSRSGYEYFDRRGHIPGAIWGQSGTDAYHMQHYRSPANTMRPFPEILANWRTAGLDPDKPTAFYCGTGWRASEAFFYARLMAWPKIKIYDGGWFEWSQDPRNPVVLGPNPHY